MLLNVCSVIWSILQASQKIVTVEQKLTRGWGGENAYHVSGYRYFFSQPCLSTFFIKKKAVTNTFLMRPNRTWPTQEHKGLKTEKHWKNAHKREKTQPQHAQQQATRGEQHAPQPTNQRCPHHLQNQNLQIETQQHKGCTAFVTAPRSPAAKHPPKLKTNHSGKASAQTKRWQSIHQKAQPFRGGKASTCTDFDQQGGKASAKLNDLCNQMWWRVKWSEGRIRGVGDRGELRVARTRWVR